MTPFETATLAIATTTLCFSTLGWFVNRYLNERKEFDKEKEQQRKEQMDYQIALQETKDDLRKEIEAERKKTTASEISKIVDEVKRLVNEIKKLFEKQEGLQARVVVLEQKTGQQTVRCNERERLVFDLKTKQEQGLERVNNLEIMGGSRKGDPPLDRSDRES